MMTVYEAIAEMRRLSDKRIAFSFSYMSYSMDRRTSHGIVTVPRATLRKQSTKETNKHADHLLNYFDLSVMENRQCWQPLIMTFNNESLELNYGRT